MARNSFQPPPSFERKLACMDAGGRAASGTGGRGIQEGRPKGKGMADFTGWRVRLWYLGEAESEEMAGFVEWLCKPLPIPM